MKNRGTIPLNCRIPRAYLPANSYYRSSISLNCLTNMLYICILFGSQIGNIQSGKFLNYYNNLKILAQTKVKILI